MTGVAPGSLPTATDDAARWRAAKQLRRENPRWVVIWLASAGCYRAYPLFRAPRGTKLTAASPEQLTGQMNQIRQAARRPRRRAENGTRAP